MSLFVMKRDALCTSDRVSLWKISVSQSPAFQGHQLYVSSLKAMHCAVAAGRACSFEDHFIKPRKA